MNNGIMNNGIMNNSIMNDLTTMKAWQDAANSLAKFVDEKGDEKMRKAFADIKEKWMLALQQEMDTCEEIIEAPEDATHYSHEDDDWFLTYWKKDGYTWWHSTGADHGWIKLSRNDLDERERIPLHS